MLYSPAYLAENAGGLRQGWPPVPMPPDADALHASAALGAKLAALLDLDTPMPGVTAGALRPEIAAIAVPATLPGHARDWSLHGWGNRTAAGITMPQRGHTTARPYAAGEQAVEQRSATLGVQAVDVGMRSPTCSRRPGASPPSFCSGRSLMRPTGHVPPRTSEAWS